MRGMGRSEIRSILRSRVIEQALSTIGETNCTARRRAMGWTHANASVSCAARLCRQHSCPRPATCGQLVPFADGWCLRLTAQPRATLRGWIPFQSPVVAQHPGRVRAP